MVKICLGKEKSPYRWILLALPVLYVLYAYYIYVAGSTVPIMDYWAWIDQFGADAMNNQLDFWTLCSDSGVHSQPLILYLTFQLFRITKFSIPVCMVLGTIGIIALSCGISGVFLYWNKSNGAPLWKYVTAVVIAMSICNFSSWELYSEPFVMGTAIRCISFSLLFACTSAFFGKYTSKSCVWRFWAFLALLTGYAFVTLTISAAYFVALLGAFFGGYLLFVTQEKHYIEKKVWLVGICILAFMAALLLIYLTQAKLTAGGVGGKGIIAALLDGTVIKGMLILLGSGLLPSATLAEYGLAPYYAIGVFIALIAIGVIVLCLVYKMQKEAMYPTMCIAYAGINAVVIAAGRGEMFSLEYLTSSRYTVEANFVLIGIVWMMYLIHIRLHEHGKSNKKAATTVCCVSLLVIMVVGLFNNLYSEMKMAPYRQVYYENLETMMLDINNYSDEDLVAFQNNPETVRRVVKMLKENELSIFAESDATGQGLPNDV